MQVLLELQLDLLVNMLLIRFSTHAPEVATEIKTPTTEFLEKYRKLSFGSCWRIRCSFCRSCCCWKSLWKIKYFITYDLKLKSDCYKLLINDC